MYQQRKVIIGALIVYLILLISFFVLRNKEQSNNDCGFSNFCIRFCCKDNATCNETYIIQNFNESNFGLVDEDGKPKELNIYFGEPKCHLTMIDSSIHNSEFSTVWKHKTRIKSF